VPEPDALLVRLEATPDELRVLRSALLAARATELGELQRRGGRLSYGYGTESAREGMSSEVGRLRLRVEMLDRLLAALDDSAVTAPAGEASAD
jgi:hypothetical protein